MYKYGEPLNINNGISKSMIPRNLTYRSSNSNNSSVSSFSSSSAQTSGNFTTANVGDLTASTINVMNNTSTPNIVIGSPVAFSLLKTDYISNNFSSYPIYFSQDILIKNKNLYIQTENLKIKDNVIMINSDSLNAAIVNNTTDNVLSGFIFPIADRNIDTGYYAGLIYFPNNKIQPINQNSTVYEWVATQYNYFTNINKGYFKLKYLSQNVTFSQYENNLDASYSNLININSDLTNLLAASIGVGDGEITSINGAFLSLNISDGIILFQGLKLTKSTINIYNNLSITFIDNLLIENNNDSYIEFGNNLTTFNQNTLYNTPNFNINFNNVLNFIGTVTNKTMIKITSTTDKIELMSTTFVNDIVVLSSFQLNNIPIIFVNTLSILGNNLSFIYFDALNNKIILQQPTTIDILNITTSLNMRNNKPIIFSNILNIEDKNGSSYIFFDSSSNHINLLKPTYISNLLINTSLLLLNDIPITVMNNFNIQNNIGKFISFNINNSIFYNSIYLIKSTPIITFTGGNTLSIIDTNKITALNIDSGINIVGPFNGYTDISNTCVNSSLSITNTAILDYNFTYTPIDKTYILAGVTIPNYGLLKLVCYGVCFQNLMSGTIIGTTRSINTNNICIFNISIWTFINDNGDLDIAYNTIMPINTLLIGDWVINSLTIDQPNYDYNYNLTINCVGSSSDKVVWSFKVCVLSV